jgi:hypothetical protein
LRLLAPPPSCVRNFGILYLENSQTGENYAPTHTLFFELLRGGAENAYHLLGFVETKL